MNERASALPGGTDWQRLGAMSDADIKRASAADPQAHLTDANFWKDAKAVIPLSKKRR